MEASQFGSPGAWGQLRADDKCGLFCRDSMISAQRVKKMRQSGFENTELPESVQKGTNLILAKATTCGHLRPIALAATCGHLRPLALAVSCSHSIGCKWLQVVADEKRMRAATGGHWRPLEWLQVAASGCKWLQVAADEKPHAGGHWRPLAATCGHSSGCKWLQVAAAEKRMLADTGGHWRSLDWLQVAASGCR